MIDFGCFGRTPYPGVTVDGQNLKVEEISADFMLGAVDQSWPLDII